MGVQFAHIGMNNVVQTNRVLAMIPPKTKTANRILEVAKQRGQFIDASRGRSHRALLMLDDGTVIASTITTATLTKRFNMKPEDIQNDFQDENEMERLESDEENEEE